MRGKKEVCMIIEVNGLTIEIPKGMMKCYIAGTDSNWQLHSDALTTILKEALHERTISVHSQ